MPTPKLTTPAPSPLLAALQPTQDLSPRDRRLMVSAVALAHIAGLWALMQLDAVQQVVRDAAPMMVDLLGPPKPQTPPPPPPPPSPVKQVAPAPAPLIAAAPSPTPAPAEFVVPVPDPVPPPPVITAPAPPAPPAPPAVQAPPPVPAAKKIPASALRYQVQPRLNFPLLSRRAGESGEVVLRIVVDVHGRLKDAWVQKSSGFARIDQAALQDMRSARFVPYTDDGQPVEVESSALLAYDLDR